MLNWKSLKNELLAYSEVVSAFKPCFSDIKLQILPFVKVEAREMGIKEMGNLTIKTYISAIQMGFFIFSVSSSLNID